jgi:hypothetical protein
MLLKDSDHHPLTHQLGTICEIAPAIMTAHVKRLLQGECPGLVADGGNGQAREGDVQNVVGDTDGMTFPKPAAPAQYHSCHERAYNKE